MTRLQRPADRDGKGGRAWHGDVQEMPIRCNTDDFPCQSQARPVRSPHFNSHLWPECILCHAFPLEWLNFVTRIGNNNHFNTERCRGAGSRRGACGVMPFGRTLCIRDKHGRNVLYGSSNQPDTLEKGRWLHLPPWWFRRMASARRFERSIMISFFDARTRWGAMGKVFVTTI